MSKILSRRDMDFILFEWLQVDALLDNQLYSEHDKETIQATIDLAELIATDYFQSANRVADQNEPVMMSSSEVALPDEIGTALAAFADAGLLSASWIGRLLHGCRRPVPQFRGMHYCPRLRRTYCSNMDRNIRSKNMRSHYWLV